MNSTNTTSDIEPRLRVEVITSVRRQRRWSVPEKKFGLVEEADTTRHERFLLGASGRDLPVAAFRVETPDDRWRKGGRRRWRHRKGLNLGP